MVEFSRLQLTSSGNLTLKKKCLPGSNPPSWPGLWVTLLKLTCSRAYASKQSQDQTSNKLSLAQRVRKWSKVKTIIKWAVKFCAFCGISFREMIAVKSCPMNSPFNQITFQKSNFSKRQFQYWMVNNLHLNVKIKFHGHLYNFNYNVWTNPIQRSIKL